MGGENALKLIISVIYTSYSKQLFKGIVEIERIYSEAGNKFVTHIFKLQI